MKSKILLISASLLLLSVTIGFTQGNYPCVNGTTTDPDNTSWPLSIYNNIPYKMNTGTNKFDWRDHFFPISIPNSDYSTYTQVESPYWLGYHPKQDGYSDIGWDQNSDFQNSNGWELIKKNFGKSADGSVNQEATYGPYFVLYNKYTGKLRVIGWFGATQNGDFPAVTVILGFEANGNTTPVTAIFNNYDAIAQPLTETTKLNEVISTTFFPGSASFPFFADFQLAYDPCTCFKMSTLVFTFTKIQKGIINLSGRILATSTTAPEVVADMDRSKGTDEFNFSTYLSSVFTNNKTTDNLETGLITYQRIDDIIGAYKSQNTGISGEDEVTAFEILKSGLELGASFVPGGKDVTEAQKSLKEGLERAAHVSDFLSVLVKGTGENKTWPSIIQGEMALTGTLKTESPQYGAGFRIANPGSLNSNTSPECCDGLNHRPDYPMYNEVLGTFALLKTPHVNHYVNMYSVPAPQAGRGGSSWNVGRRDEFQITENLQYVFNPAVNVDEALTTITAALVVETDIDIEAHNVNEAYFTANKSVYITDFASLECLSKEVPLFEKHALTPLGGSTIPYYNLQNVNYKVYLKLIVNIVSNNLDSDGKNNTSAFILKYPVIIDDKTGQISTFPFYQGYSYISNLGIIPGIQPTRANPNPVQSITYTTDPNLYAWNITIAGTLLTALPTPGRGYNPNPPPTLPIVHMTAGDLLTIDAGSTISGDFVLATGDVPVISCGSPYTQISNADVKTFCQSTDYKASTFVARTAYNGATASTNANPTINNTKPNGLTLDVVPNPFSDFTAVRYSIATGDIVSISVTSVLGEKILDLQNSYQSSGNYEIILPASNLSSGVYYCTIQTSSGIITKRIVVVK
jgi:hypothetical protein